MRAPDYAPLDAALDTIAAYGINLTNGNSNHAPMAVETLCALGYPQTVLPWLARYRARMVPRPAPVGRIDAADWQPALGRRERFADWAGFFTEELQEAPWPVVLDRWVDRLAPGFCAAGAHGPIRVGHAARALGQHDTPARRRELADALASWAATWQALPEGDGAGGTLSPAAAIAQVPLVPAELRRAGNIVANLAALADFAEFAPAAGRLDRSRPPAAVLAAATEVFARVYLANAHDIATTIAFIHTVTSHAALGNMLPHLSEATARRALGYAWQTGCGLYACYGGATALVDDIPAATADPEALAEGAVGHGDEHAIKFTEACLARHRIDPAPAYLAAAAHVTAMLPRR